MAFVTQKYESPPDSVSRVFELLRERSKIDVQALAISQVRLCENADSLGKIAAPVGREGRLIAGCCERPEVESKPILKPVDFLGWRSGALRCVASASKNLAMAIDLARTSNLQSELGDFVAASSDAAERCARIAFGKLTSGTDVPIPIRHQINEIVGILDGLTGASALASRFPPILRHSSTNKSQPPNWGILLRRFCSVFVW